MCGRFTLTESDRVLLAGRLGIAADALADYRPRYNIAPLQGHFVITTAYENRKLLNAKWGLVPHWAKNVSRAAQSINAKAETVEVKPTFGEAFRRRRCVVPADGFYEWTGTKDARRPLWIHRHDGEPLLFAGLYETWQPKAEQAETTFTILTCAPNSLIAPIHNRMPVILSDRDAEEWINPRESEPLSLKRLLVPASDDLLVVQPASLLVNNVKNEGPELLDGFKTQRQLMFQF
jgi:putative SOS response-associated peptidase YedK